MRSHRVAEQGPLLQAFPYKILWSNTFNEYVNFCSVTMRNAARTNAVKAVFEDYLDLNIKNKKYRYFEDMRDF